MKFFEEKELDEEEFLNAMTESILDEMRVLLRTAFSRGIHLGVIEGFDYCKEQLDAKS
jgi:hypothetical protein